MLTLTMFSVITRCLGFVYKIYLTKIMSTTELGIYNLTASVYMVLITLVSASIPLTISKITANNIATNKSHETKYSITSSLILTSTISIFLCLLLIISKPVLTLIIGDPIGYNIILYLLPSVIFSALYSQIRGYLWGLENYFAVSIVEFIEQILRIAFCVIFVLSGIITNPLIAVGLSLSIACGISTLFGFYLYFKNNGKLKYRIGYFKEIIRSSTPLTFVRLFGSILQPLIAVIIPIMLCKLGMSKTEALSELGIVMGMTMPLLTIPSTIIGALCMILIPRINSNTNKNNINKQLKNYLSFTISCIFIFIPIFISIGGEICKFVYGNIDSGIYLAYSAWTMIPLGFAQITTSILNALNKEKLTFIYYIISSAILIGLCFILPDIFGVLTMLIANGISSLILAILNLIKIKKITDYKYDFVKPLLIHILLSLPVILLTKFCYNILTIYFGTFLCIMLTCIISVISYLSLLIVFGAFEISIIKDYISRINKKQQA